MKRIFTALLLFFSITVIGQAIPERPYPARLVNDLANVIPDNQERELESMLVDFARGSSNQITIVTVPSLDGYDKADYAFKLGESWGIGQKEEDNGIVMLVKPKNASAKGEAFIAVGYGLEGIIPDAIASRIVNYDMIPEFKNGDYYAGISKGVTSLAGLANGEYTYQEYDKRTSGSGAGGFLPILVIMIFYMLFLGRRRRYYTAGGKRSSLPFWMILWGLNSGRNGSHGYWNDFNSGGGHFGGGFGSGGGGGGGFGGFGGGSFGGGGAGGSW